MAVFKKNILIFIFIISSFATLITTGSFYLLKDRIDNNKQRSTRLHITEVSGTDNDNVEVVFDEKNSCHNSEKLKALYVINNTGRKIYVLKFFGKGLWGDIEGVLAFDDKKIIQGVSFYEHQETPGLGGEISSEAFENSFKGKTFFSSQNKFKGLKITNQSEDDSYSVDAVSGATLTSRAVEKIINDAVREFSFIMLRGESG